MFWGFVALLTLIAAASIALPLLRARAGGPGRAEFDRAVYRDQLGEIERDVERGVLSPAEAKAARVEIERRLLATIEEKEGPAAGRVDPITVVSLTAAVAAGSVALYMAIGSPTVPGQPISQRVPEQQAPGAPPPGDLVASAERLERRLRDNPNDVEGWMLLGRTQAILERFTAAAESYKRALQIAPMIPDANAGYGEMLVLSSNNVVTAPAVAAFRKALVGDPQNLAARFYLAAYDAQEGRLKEAVEGWRKIEADSPADAPWRPALRERIEATAKEAGLPVPPVAAGPPPAAPPQAPAPPRVAAAPNPHPPIGPPAASPAAPKASEAPRGPSAAEVAAAQNMRPEDRQQMIRTMVDGLAARLEQNPDDVAGWQRLARAWRVLGEKQKAEEALGRVASLRPDDAEAQLEHARAMLDTEGGAGDPRKPLPPKFVAAVERVAALDPKNQDALWYLGLAAAQRQDKPTATRLWNQLLAMLSPGSDDHRTVKEALEALGAK